MTQYVLSKTCINRNYDKILLSDWLSAVLISALIGQHDRTVHVMHRYVHMHPLEWFYFYIKLVHLCLAQLSEKRNYRLIRLKIRCFRGCKNFPGSLFHCIAGFIGFIRLKIRNARCERIYLVYFTNIRSKETPVIRHQKNLLWPFFHL